MTKEALQLRYEVVRDILKNIKTPKEAIFADVTTSERSGYLSPIMHVRRYPLPFKAEEQKKQQWLPVRRIQSLSKRTGLLALNAISWSSERYPLEFGCIMITALYLLRVFSID